MLAIQQNEQVNKELTRLQNLESTYKNIFVDNWVHKGFAKMTPPLTTVEGVYQRVDELAELLPEPDNANSFFIKLLALAEQEGIEVSILKDTKLSRDFYTENQLLIEVKGSIEALQGFSIQVDKIKQINSLTDTLPQPDKENTYHLLVSVYSQYEGANLTYEAEKGIANMPYVQSKVWLPYFSGRSKASTKEINRLIKAFKDNREQVNAYFDYRSKEYQFLDMTVVIRELTKAKQPISAAFKGSDD